jgi:hypothetical protein
MVHVVRPPAVTDFRGDQVAAIQRIVLEATGIATTVHCHVEARSCHRAIALAAVPAFPVDPASYSFPISAGMAKRGRPSTFPPETAAPICGRLAARDSAMSRRDEGDPR